MKKVVDTDTVAHLFAHQKQEEARNANKNLYFEDNTIYSYGRHFPIAKHVKNIGGEKGLLFTTRTHSVTTSRQVNTVNSACNHLNIIYCYSPNSDHKENLSELHKLIEQKLKGFEKAKKPEKYVEAAKTIFEYIQKYCEFFSLNIPANSKELIESLDNNEYNLYLEKEAKRIEADKKRQRNNEIKRFRTSLKKWRDNSSHRITERPFDLDYLRFNSDKNRIETSQGIQIPVKIALKAFKFIINKVSSGGCENPDYEILDYGIKSITKDHLTIGCHRIDMVEIKSLARQMTWIPPSKSY